MFKATIAAAGLALALSGAAFAQNQDGLVNVAVDDSLNDIASNNAVQIPIGIAAQVCGVSVDALAIDEATNTATGCTLTQEMVSDNEAFNNFVNRGGGNEAAPGQAKKN